MAVNPFKTFSAGEILTAADLNSSITQITSNGEDLGWPATKAKDFAGQELVLDSDGDTSIHSSTDDQIDFKLSGTDIVAFKTVSSAVNGFVFTGSATGNAVDIAAVGTDTDISISLTAKGAGTITGVAVNDSNWSGTDLAVANGGTGSSTAGAARTALGLAIGTDIQAQDAGLDDIAALAVTNGLFIVGDGSNWVAESASPARASLGLGTAAVEAVGVANGNVPQMDATGYPAADGSQITGLSQGFTGIQIITATGTYTPTAGTLLHAVYTTGAGGGSGGADQSGATDVTSGGGGGGGTSFKIFNTTEMGATAAVAIGTGGAAGSGTNGTDGSVGGNTTFNPVGTGATLTGNGGGGGFGTGSNNFDLGTGGGNGGTATNGDIDLKGSDGGSGAGAAFADIMTSGQGGASYWGGGGDAQQGNVDFTGTAGVSHGSGAGGAGNFGDTTGTAGAAGAAGVVVVFEYA
jgi:hypothetical protein